MMTNGGCLPLVALASYSANLNAHNAAGATPLHLACQCGRLGIAALLVRRGATFTENDEDGKHEPQVLATGWVLGRPRLTYPLPSSLRPKPSALRVPGALREAQPGARATDAGQAVVGAPCSQPWSVRGVRGVGSVDGFGRV